MSTPIPLSFSHVARAQVSQFIEGSGPAAYDNQATVLDTVAQTNSGASAVTWATEPSPVEYYQE
jgi:hypothetical protein